MNEQKLIRKQLIKNMLYTFIVFAVILLMFDAIIYNQISLSLYKSIDEELLEAGELYESKELQMEIGKSISDNSIQIIKEISVETKLNPRLICIVRDSQFEILNSENIGTFYDDYINEVGFDKVKIGEIYSIKVNGIYNYRAVNLKISTIDNQEMYVQLLANVDGEVETIGNIINVLFIGSLVIIIIAMICSYILSKITLKPIIISWEKQTEFVQNAAHELRTPLTIIQAKQELLLQEPNSKIIDKSDDINIILKETKRLTKLIKELMILAMADSNELKLNKEKIDIDKLINEISIPYKECAQVQNKELVLNLKYGKELNIDRNKINQLMVILLDNAIKYTSEKEKIIVNTYAKDGKCMLEVNDTGIGISKDAIKHIFDRFYREDKARSRETGGTGLRTFNSTYNNKFTRREY